MNRVLIYNVDNPFDHWMKPFLRFYQDLLVQPIDSFHQAERYLKMSDTKVLVISMNEILTEARVFCQPILEIAKKIPVLIFSPSIKTKVFFHAAETRNIRVFEIPKESPSIANIVAKVIRDRGINQPIARRFSVDEKAEILVYGKDEIKLGFMRNLSLAGAYLEWVPTGYQFTDGDLLKLTVNLEKTGRIYQINAEVIWVDALTANQQFHSMGVSFLKKDEWYQKLINRY